MYLEMFGPGPVPGLVLVSAVIQMDWTLALSRTRLWLVGREHLARASPGIPALEAILLALQGSGRCLRSAYSR